MKPSKALALHRDAILEVLARYPVANPMLYGSVLKGQDTDASDLDIMVEPVGRITFFDLAALEEELGRVAGVKVDIRTSGEFSERVKRFMDFKPLQ
ncbi:MAG: nucleotidyltransferase domain-containing protein [Rhizobiaceae bacterium]|jgi:hypothetical protein|nr:nucleotidyltransferase domain-containing protein [Rhizobiaceae bacterium]